MNFLTKSRLIFWILSVLVVINLAALASFFFFTRSAAGTSEENACCPPGQQTCTALHEELGLSDSQTGEVAAINNTYSAVAGPLASEIRETRSAILNELENKTPDNRRIDSLIQRIASLQVTMQKENIRQYSALRRVCNPEQAQKLSAIYRELYGCPMQKGGMNHRYRHGQGKGCDSGGR